MLYFSLCQACFCPASCLYHLGVGRGRTLAVTLATQAAGALDHESGQQASNRHTTDSARGWGSST